MNLERLGLWPARLLWLAAPLAIGPALADPLDSKASTPGLVVEVALWLAWFGVLVSLLTPSPRSLTISRIAGPAALGVAVLTAVSEGFDRSTMVAIGFAAVTSAVVALPTFGDRMINGSAYGSERRMALRPPAVALVGPMQLAWAAVFAGLVTAPLLVLDERWIPAAVAAVVGAAFSWAGWRVLHQLARRWVVFVPAGFVLVDPLHLVDAVLLRRNEVAALGPALVPAAEPSNGHGQRDDVVRIDLSGGALGLALEVALRTATPVTVRSRERSRAQVDSRDVTNLVFTPTLPGALLAEARIRGLRIGEAPVG